MRENLNGRIEQDEAADPLGPGARELEQEPAAERVPDPVGLLDPERIDGVDQIGDMRLEVPWRFVPGAAVPAQIRRDDPEARRPALEREPPLALAVRRHAVQAEKRWTGRITPLVRMQDHAATRTLRRCRTAGSTSGP